MVISTSINGLADQTADLLAKWNFQKNKDSEEVFEKPVLKKKTSVSFFLGGNYRNRSTYKEKGATNSRTGTEITLEY